MKQIERTELLRRASAMSPDEQSVMISRFDSKIIAAEYYRRLSRREQERMELQAILNKYQEEE